MPVYVIAAYGIFCLVPAGLGVAIYMRSRRVVRDIEALGSEPDPPSERMERR